MTKEFDEFWQQRQAHFVDETPPLPICRNCGKDIIPIWKFKGETLFLHPDKSMCSTIAGSQ